MKRAFLCFLFATAALSACKSNNNTPTAPSAGVPFSSTDLRVGNGTEAQNGRILTVNYTGWLYEAGASQNKGRQFDSSLNPGRTPFTFTLGARQVIAGWDQGVLGMRVGGQRRLVIPPELGYGSAGNPAGGIPGNATLVFEVELLNVQ